VIGPTGYNPGRDPDAPHASRAAPLAESICWRPTEGEATGPGAQQYPIYVRQRALAALHDHYRGSATQGILGFLVGALLEDPTTRERWLELEFIVRLTQPIYGDKTTLVISRVWERLQQEVGRTGGHMLGWYHSHPPLGVEIAPGDIEAHEQYFGRPWQIALVLGQTPKGPTGAFYRPSAGLPLGTTPLPFFEIIARDSITPEGRKRTRVTWKNHRPG
jgi:proteasome lid subunit RPN8/RPN11